MNLLELETASQILENTIAAVCRNVAEPVLNRGCLMRCAPIVQRLKFHVVTTPSPRWHAAMPSQSL